MEKEVGEGKGEWQGEERTKLRREGGVGLIGLWV